MKDLFLALELTLYGLVAVFGVLLLFYAAIVILRRAAPHREGRRADPPAPAHTPSGAAPPPALLELVGVDERTAAIIIAIVAEETGIDPDLLNIRSIKKVEGNGQ